MEFDDGLKTNGSIKLSSNSVTDRMVEAVQQWVKREAGYLTLTDEFVRGLIDAALREQPAPEPVAWMLALPDGRLDRLSVVAYDDEVTELLSRSIAGCTIVPLYAHPPQRKPLTEEEIVDAVREADLDWQAGGTLDEDAPNRFTTLTRAIELAHGIGGEK